MITSFVPGRIRLRSPMFFDTEITQTLLAVLRRECTIMIRHQQAYPMSVISLLCLVSGRVRRTGKMR